MEQVPDDLEADFLGGLEHREPARPVVLARRLLDQVPAKAVPKRPEAELMALAIVTQHVPVVSRGTDKVEPNAIATAMRRTFKARLEEAGEGLTETIVHECR